MYIFLNYNIVLKRKFIEFPLHLLGTTAAGEWDTGERRLGNELFLDMIYSVTLVKGICAFSRKKLRYAIYGVFKI